MAILSALPQVSLAADYKSVGDAPAILYDAPTLRGKKLAVAPRGMPVEIVVVQQDWDRVRDASGEFSWIDKHALVDRRTVVTTTATAVKSGADDRTTTLLHLESGVWVELLDPPVNGYAHVRHRDGVTGFVHVTDVWGL
jgi:SH3-like domain-containing protein